MVVDTLPLRPLLACLPVTAARDPARTRVSSRAKVERPSEKAASQLGEARIGGRVVDWSVNEKRATVEEIDW